MKHNKPNWTLYLVDHALHLEHNDDLSRRLKINTLKTLKKDKEAIIFANMSMKILPDNRIIRILLIDLYLDLGNIQDAKAELEEALLKRLKKINDSYLNQKFDKGG